MAEKYPGTPVAAAAAPAAAEGKPSKQYGVFSRSAAEAFGAFLLVLGGVAVTMFGSQGGIPGTLAFGLLFIAGIIAVGHISGGHFNPALTLGFAVAGRLSWKDVLPYVLAQVIGGAAAAGLLWVVLSGGPEQIAGQIEGIFGSVSAGFGQNSPSQFPLTSVLLLQVILVAVFAGVYLAATSGRANKSLAPFAAGLTYAVVLQVSVPVSGGGLNPARSTATVLFADAAAAGQLWLFWVAPLAGAAIAGLLYRSFEPVPSGKADGGAITVAGTDGGTTDVDRTDGAPDSGVRTDDAPDSNVRHTEAGTRTGETSTSEAPSSETSASGTSASETSASGTHATGAAETRNTGRHAEPGDEDDARDFFDGPGRK